MIIEIEKLTFEAIIGILPFERDNPQKVEIDIVIEYGYPCSSCKDGFIDYANICEIVKSSIKSNRYELLEDAIYGLKEIIISHYPQIKSISISIAKPDILSDCIVRVQESF